MIIGRKDIYWNYGATFLRIASSVLLLPLILKLMPSEMVGIWSIFMSITAFTILLDLGFNPSFTRNITYIFSGVNNLKVTGFDVVNNENITINYSLLKGVISAMRWFYLRMAIFLFLLLATLGTYYISYLLKNYVGNQYEIYIAWFLLCIINTYNLYSIYYDSLLQGKGLIKRSKQITIIGQLIYLLVAGLLIIYGFGLIAIVSAQAISVVIIRFLSYKSFFTNEIKIEIKNAENYSRENILKAIYPNALKIGFTSLGSFLVQRSSLIIGSLFLSLGDIATYGITMQLISVLGGLATVYMSTYQPLIAHQRVKNKLDNIKDLYIKGLFFMFVIYLIGSLFLVLFGDSAFSFIGSQTKFLPIPMLSVALLIGFLESNHSMAGGIMLSKNEVPFFKAALYSGAATFIVLIVLFKFTNLGLWSMIIAPGIVQGVYQNWKWPTVVKHELKITTKYSYNILKQLLNLSSDKRK